MSIGGGWVDTLAMRLLDITVPFPFFVLVLAIVAVLGPGIENYFIALALVGWVGYARLARAEAIVLRSFEFVLAVRTMGFSHHAKNHSLLYTGNRLDDRPELAPFYDIVPTIIDSSVVHQLSFDIGAAQMTDEITSEDIAAFAADLGYRRVTPALVEEVAENHASSDR